MTPLLYITMKTTMIQRSPAYGSLRCHSQSLFNARLILKGARFCLHGGKLKDTNVGEEGSADPLIPSVASGD